MSEVIKGSEWREYLESRMPIDQVKSFATTYKFVTIYKTGDYYWCFQLNRGYRNLAALKRLITQYYR